MTELVHRVWIGLGGNVGDVKGHMQGALEHLDQSEAIRVAAVSPIYKTPPWGKLDQNWFLNACSEIRTSLAPGELMDALLEAERSRQRVRKERWGPRTIDLDMLLYDDLYIESDKITLPHARMLERAFVLKPLLDLAGPIIVEGKSIADWLVLLDDSDIQLHSQSDWFATPN